MKFQELNLEADLQKSIDRHGYSECTPIQAQAIPHILEGQDIAGLAQTGTGKTAAFVIPMIERILRAKKNQAQSEGSLTDELSTKRAFKDWKSNHFILIVVPTRELAEQVQTNITQFGTETKISSTAIYGGTSYDKQKEALNKFPNFIVATPGRLIDLYKEHLIDLKQVRSVIFDEADRMFDMGFKDDMKYILQRIPKERQFLVFSATLNFDVLNTAYQFGAEPIEINISRDQAKADNVEDQIFHVGQDEKPQHLLSLLLLHKPKQAIIFSNFKHNVDRVAQFLVQNNLPASGISSLLSQAQRNRVLDLFKSDNNNNILVATDVAARGLDIKGVDLVINYELPNDSESYVHRIGRTGRAGNLGKAFSLVSDKDVEALERIESYLKHKVAVGFIENENLIKDFLPMKNEYYDRGHQSLPSRSGRRGPNERRERPDERGRSSQGRNRMAGKGKYSQRSDSSSKSKFRSERTEEGKAPIHRSKSKPYQYRQQADTRSGNISRNTSKGPSKLKSSSASKTTASPTKKPIVQKIKSIFKKIFGVSK